MKARIAAWVCVVGVAFVGAKYVHFTNPFTHVYTVPLHEPSSAALHIPGCADHPERCQ